ncbi:MAG: hypothetical protein ABI333_16395 [bacterium]
MKTLIALSVTVIALSGSPVAYGQASPSVPTYEHIDLPSRAPQKQTERSSSVTVTRSKGCVTVQVCPGVAPAPVPAPPAATPAPAPPPPPAAPAPSAAPPPPPSAAYGPYVYRHPYGAPAMCAQPVAKPTTPPPVLDPARTRLSVSNTAEVLGHGDWEIAARELGGLFEVSVGLGGRFQIGVKMTPIFWAIPGVGFKHSLWAAEVRAQVVKTSLFKLTGDFTYFHVMGMHGIKTGASMKIGNDKLAFHAGLGMAMLFVDAEAADTCGGPVAYDSSSDCGGGSEPVKPFTMMTANAGFEARFWKYGKFVVDAFVATSGRGDTEMLLWAVVPGVRFHNTVFAADLALGVLGIGDLKVPFPVVNFSWRF